MAELGKRLGMFLIGNLILYGICAGAENLMNGKDILGRDRKPREDTYMDWKGNVHLGQMDYQVV